jgi:hypothetical protein
MVGSSEVAYSLRVRPVSPRARPKVAVALIVKL